MHCLSSFYFVSQPLHVSGISVAHHQEVYCLYIYIYIHIFIYIQHVPIVVYTQYTPDDGLQMGPKHVEID